MPTKLVVQNIKLVLMEWCGDEDPDEPYRSTKTTGVYSVCNNHPIMYVAQCDVAGVMKYYGRDNVSIKRSWDDA